MPNVIKVGDKEKHVMIPDDYELVIRSDLEYVKEGDKFLNLFNNRWDDVESDDIGMPTSQFDFLIRKVNK